jgi:uracil phosphoribosyltransferase
VDDVALVLAAWFGSSFEGGRHLERINKVAAAESSGLFTGGPGRVVVFHHPLVRHKMSVLRDKNTGVKEFRELVQEIAGLMLYEITKKLPLSEVQVETPLASVTAHVLKKEPVLVPVLRAGLSMADGMLRFMPNARVGHIGLYRDPVTLDPVEYYCKLPEDIEERDIFVLDPMLATGGSASAAISLVKAKGGRNISLACLIAAPEGIGKIREKHPDTGVFTAALDSGLDGRAYIVPGLGDAGDRLFGTKRLIQQ